MATDSIFVSLPFREDAVNIVEIKCISHYRDDIKKYLTEKLGDDPRFRILPARSEDQS